MNWGKIAVATRMNDRCDPVFFNCWTKLVASGLRNGDVVLGAGIELPQHFAATVITKRFLKSDADTLFFVDTDMIFKPEDLQTMRDDPAGQEYGILSALSVVRRKPFHPIVLKLKSNPENAKCAYEYTKPSPEDHIVECDSVGTGFTLIRREVFERMQNEIGIDEWFFDFGQGGLGEDTCFCQRAKQLGIKIGVHGKVCIGHRGPITFVWDSETQTTRLEASDQIAELLM